MAIKIPRGLSDSILDQIVEVLRRFEVDHPHAEIDLYRQNSVSIRVRIVDRCFKGQGKAERNDAIWRYLDSLPDDVQGDISTLVLLTPDETATSFANVDFNDPVPSKL